MKCIETNSENHLIVNPSEMSNIIVISILPLRTHIKTLVYLFVYISF